MNTVYVAPPYVWAIGATILIYLATAGYLMNYLKRIHPDTWIQLGSLSIILNNSIRNGFLTLGFIFGRRYRLLNDIRLSRIIWAVRGLFVFCFLLIAAEKLFHALPPR